MTDPDHSRKLTWGILLISIGVILLARTMGLISSDELWRTLIAISLIALGIYLIIRKRRKEQVLAEQRASLHEHPGQSSEQPGPAGPSAQTAYGTSGPSQSSFTEAPREQRQGDLEYRKLLGDMFIDADGLGFENIEVSSGIGDLEIRLKGARLITKLNRVVISGFIGDLRVYIPRGMAYSANCSNFIGDIDVAGKHASGFGNNVSAFSTDYDTAEQKLYIAANSFIGDIKIFVVD